MKRFIYSVLILITMIFCIRSSNESTNHIGSLTEINNKIISSNLKEEFTLYKNQTIKIKGEDIWVNIGIPDFSFLEGLPDTTDWEIKIRFVIFDSNESWEGYQDVCSDSGYHELVIPYDCPYTLKITNFSGKMVAGILEKR